MARRVLEKRDDGWEIGLAGWRVDRICVDYQVRLHFNYSPQGDWSAEERFEIVLESPFTVQTADGVSSVEPNGKPDGYGPALALLQLAIERAFVGKDGTLSVDFGDATRLRCVPDPKYEAWQLSGPGLLVVCVPGAGEPAIWLGDESAD